MNTTGAGPFGAVVSHEPPPRSAVLAPERHPLSGKYRGRQPRSDKHRQPKPRQSARVWRLPHLAVVGSVTAVAVVLTVIAVFGSDSTTQPPVESWRLEGTITEIVFDGPYSISELSAVIAVGDVVSADLDCPDGKCEIVALDGFYGNELLTPVVVQTGGERLEASTVGFLYEADPAGCEPVTFAVVATRQADGSYRGTYRLTPALTYWSGPSSSGVGITVCQAPQYVAEIVLTPLP